MASTVIDKPAEDLARLPEWIEGRHDLASVTERVCRAVERPRASWAWRAGLGVSLGLTAVFLAMVGYLIGRGVGVWGVNDPVGWGFAIVNFVFWIGIGHAGTLFSAILFLLRQRWRTSIHRFAESMTIAAVICAAIFAAIHVGRVWVLYWLAPVPNQMGLWPNFHSPLLWDVFAVTAYFIVSLLFWYVGMIPDLATLRDRAGTRLRGTLYGLLALGWRGSAGHWSRFETAYLLLAGLATPLVVSVHSVVSYDFAVAVIPGWHSTIFPAYFVAGAVFSGVAMVLTLIVPARRLLGLEDLITPRHLDVMSKVVLGTGLLVAYAYAVEVLAAYYSGRPRESFLLRWRMWGPYGWTFWTMLGCTLLAPQALWFRRCRTRPMIIFAVSLLINIGMWLERFVIVVPSLSRDFLPSRWGEYRPTGVDLLTLAGSFGLFFTLFLLFCRLLPMVSMAEIKGSLKDCRSEPFPKRPSSPPAPCAPDEPDCRPMSRPEGDADGSDFTSPARRTSGEPAALYGLLAEFARPEALLSAARHLRNAGFTRWEAYTPFPITGLGEAAGIRPSRLPWWVFACGLLGAAGGLLLQAWVHGAAYPLLFSGKPLVNLPAFVPVACEVGILLAALAAGVGMLIRNGLPQLYHPLFTNPGFRRASADRFFIAIEARDPSFNEVSTARRMESLGSVAIERVWDRPEAGLPRSLRLAGAAVVLLALVPLALIVRARFVDSFKPPVHLIRDMDRQPNYRPQSAHGAFEDGRADRPAIAGTVAQGDPPPNPEFQEGKADGAWGTALPVPVTPALLSRGQVRFKISCSPCHGLDGSGRGPVAKRAEELEESRWVAPRNLADASVRDQPLGQIFDTITNGLGAMPPFGDLITPADRWAILSRVRQLQGIPLQQQGGTSDTDAMNSR